jgi:hypothetical protein
MMSAKGQQADLIGREELKEKLDRGDDFKLVMVLGEWEYRAKRISGSLRVSASRKMLQARVRRYAAGLEDWERAGYPLEGESVG